MAGFPPIQNQSLLSNSYFHLFGEWVDGAGNLLLDAFVLLPAEHFLAVENAAVDPTHLTRLYIYEDDSLQAGAFLAATGEYLHQTTIQAASRWHIPTAYGVCLMLAAERSASHNRDDMLAVTLTTYDRYLSSRPD